MKTVVVTGAGQGIGLGFARHYLENGCEVAATSLAPWQTESFQSLKAEYGASFIPLELDVTRKNTLDALGNSLSGLEPDILINNAGISIEEAYGQWSSAVFEANFKVNTIGPALVAQELAPTMAAGSRIINVSSGMGSLALNINPDNALDAYALSKAALNLLTRRLAEKLKPQGIVVASINPGWVKTRMGGDEAPATVEQAVNEMASVIHSLSAEHSGQFFASNGEELPW